MEIRFSQLGGEKKLLEKLLFFFKKFSLTPHTSWPGSCDLPAANTMQMILQLSNGGDEGMKGRETERKESLKATVCSVCAAANLSGDLRSD